MYLRWGEKLAGDYGAVWGDEYSRLDDEEIGDSRSKSKVELTTFPQIAGEC
jgi:hypothetical protein